MFAFRMPSFKIILQGDVWQGVPFCCLNYIMGLKDVEALLIRNGHDGEQGQPEAGLMLTASQKIANKYAA